MGNIKSSYNKKRNYTAPPIYRKKPTANCPQKIVEKVKHTRSFAD